MPCPLRARPRVMSRVLESLTFALSLGCGSPNPSSFGAGGSESNPDAGAVDAIGWIDVRTDGTFDSETLGTPDSTADSSTDGDAEPDNFDLFNQLRSQLIEGNESAARQGYAARQLNRGFPWRGDGVWLFVTDWPGVTGVSFVSDLNDWNTGSHLASSVGSLRFVILRDDEITSSVSGAKYKWFASGNVYRSPPEARAYGYDGFGEFGYVAPPANQRYLERFDGVMAPDVSPRVLRASLPAGYTRNSSDGYRFALFHDGQNLFDGAAPWGGWNMAEALRDPRLQNVIVLMLDNTPNRMAEYTHTADRVSGVSFQGQAAAYLNAVKNVYLPFFASQYGELTNVLIAGSSLGGLVSMYFGSQQSGLDHTFGCLIAMSSTLGWGAYDPSSDGAATLIESWPESANSRLPIYLDSGGNGPCADLDGDGIQEDAPDADNYCVTLQMADELRRLGYQDGVDLTYVHVGGASHNEAAWGARVAGAMMACDAMGW